MVKHSPEPWNVDVPPEGGVVVCDANGAVLLRFEDYFDEAVLDEDALLVAAAPKTAAERDRLKAVNAEMLAALKAVIESMESPYGEERQRLNDAMANVADKKVRAAIAKVEGSN